MHIIHEEIGLPKVAQTKSENYVVFTISPLPAGFGRTLGNALRRVLLSSVPGAAITAVKIDGISHEYTTLEGMRDDVLNLTLNLKRIFLEKKSKENEVAKLSKKGDGDIVAGDFKTEGDTKILNSDFVLTTLDKKNSKLDLEVRIEKGVGYLPVSEQREKDLPAGWILLDAIFSPVVKVDYKVLPMRVGQMTNLDKLEIGVETNGSISPQDAMRFASKILQSYFGLFQKDEKDFLELDFVVDFDEKMSKAKERAIEEQQEEEKESYTPVEVLNLSPRTLNALINGDIGSVEELVQCSRDKLDTLRGFGKKAMDEVNAALASRGLALPE